ncbi:MAG: proteasome assembly chaperone family protein [Candidatus Njordarchaeales archaeon]
MQEKVTSPEFFKIIEEEKIESGKYKHLIVAIPEIGLVGILALRQLVKSLNMRRVGFVVSEPTSVIIRYENKQPEPMIRLFANDDTLVLMFEAPMSAVLAIPLAKFIVKLIDEKQIELPIMLASAPSAARMQKADEEIMILAAPVGKKAYEAVEKSGVEVISNGTLSGPYAYVLMDRLIKKKTALVLLSETYQVPLVADPGSAARLLKVLAKILGKEDQINVQELLERAEEIRLEMQKLEKAMKVSLPKEVSELYT